MSTLLEWVLFVSVIFLLFKVIQLQEDVKGMSYKLKQIANHMALPENPINEDLRVLLKASKDVEAVKLVRETLGLSLVEAKQYVDALKAELT